MTRALRRLGALGPADRGLILEASALLFITRFGLHLWRFSTLRRLLDRAAPSPIERSTGGSPEPGAAERIRWAIDAAARHLPGQTTCLASALAADVMLRRRGVESTFHLGVATDRRAGEPVRAHAWVESSGTTVTGDLGSPSPYEELKPVGRPVDEALCAVIRGEDTAWRELGATPPDVVELCVRQDLAGLLLERLRGPSASRWPTEIMSGLAEVFRGDLAVESLRRRELTNVLDALSAENIHPILFKGAALAYQFYESPAARPRSDVDLIVREKDVNRIRPIMHALGYSAPTYCDGELVFRQFELSKRDAFGVDHAFDFHWKISTQIVFADVLGYEQLSAGSVEVPSLGPRARAAGPVHALLLACIHPAMHHRNEARLLWIYDVHLLVTRLTTAELQRFAALALETRVATVCAHQLALARARFGTALPASVIDTLSTTSLPEASARYLLRERRWHHEMVASIRALPGWRDRVQLAREVLLPNRQYMLLAYDIPGGARGTAMLPALYAHRALYGAWKILIGRK
jgi:hypothetical protein